MVQAESVNIEDNLVITSSVVHGSIIQVKDLKCIR